MSGFDFRQPCAECGAVRVGIAHEEGRRIELRIENAAANCGSCREWWDTCAELALKSQALNKLPSYDSFLAP